MIHIRKDIIHDDMIYNKIVEGHRKKPFIKVLPPGMVMMGDLELKELYMLAVTSWNFSDSEGMRTKVIIVSNGDEVELLVNGVSYGRRKVGVIYNYITLFEVIYYRGLIEVISYRNNLEFSREVLRSD